MAWGRLRSIFVAIRQPFNSVKIQSFFRRRERCREIVLNTLRCDWPKPQQPKHGETHGDSHWSKRAARPVSCSQNKNFKFNQSEKAIDWYLWAYDNQFGVDALKEHAFKTYKKN